MAPVSAKAASYAQFANPETFDGYVRLRAVSVPTTAITAQYYIVQGGGQADSSSDSGTVTDGYTKAQVDNKISEAIKAAVKEQKLLDHPVGSIYQSVEPTSPADLFGGEWEQLEDRMLIAASDTYPVKSTGGEAEHVLTKAEQPAISGYLQFRQAGGNNTVSTYGDATNSPFSWNSYSGDKWNYQMTSEVNSSDDNKNTLVKFDNGGTSTAHNNMPPYYAVYTWIRTA